MIINNKKYTLHPSMFKSVQKDFLVNKTIEQQYQLDPMYIYKEDAALSLLNFLETNNILFLNQPKEVFVETLFNLSIKELHNLVSTVTTQEIVVKQRGVLGSNKKLTSTYSSSFKAKNLEDLIVSFGGHATDNDVEGNILYNIRMTMQQLTQVIQDLARKNQSAMNKINFILESINSKKEVMLKDIAHLDGFEEVATMNSNGINLKLNNSNINLLKIKLIEAQKTKIQKTKLKDIPEYNMTLPELLKVVREVLGE